MPSPHGAAYKTNKHCWGGFSHLGPEVQPCLPAGQPVALDLHHLRHRSHPTGGSLSHPEETWLKLQVLLTQIVVSGFRVTLPRVGWQERARALRAAPAPEHAPSSAPSSPHRPQHWRRQGGTKTEIFWERQFWVFTRLGRPGIS